MPDVEEEAIGWVIRLAEANAEDWHAFTLWLEAEPAHRAAYDRVADIDLDARELMAARRSDAPANDLMPPMPGSPALTEVDPHERRYKPALWVGGLAAALAAIVGTSMLLRPGDNNITISTMAGEHREVRLADGTRIQLDGDSRLILDRVRPRGVELDGGEAFFTVVHDAHAPFTVRVGGTQVEDIGTRFDIRRRGAVTEVAVAAGAVLYDPRGSAIRLASGDRLRDPDGALLPERTRADPAAAGGWREAHLSFADEDYARVAADVGATSGLPLRASEAVAGRRFTGVIVCDDRHTLLHRIELLLDVRAVRQGGGWLLVPAGASR